MTQKTTPVDYLLYRKDTPFAIADERGREVGFMFRVYRREYVGHRYGYGRDVPEGTITYVAYTSTTRSGDSYGASQRPLEEKNLLSLEIAVQKRLEAARKRYERKYCR